MTNLDIKIDQVRKEINNLPQNPNNLHLYNYLTGKLDGLLSARLIVVEEQKQLEWKS